MPSCTLGGGGGALLACLPLVVAFNAIKNLYHVFETPERHVWLLRDVITDTILFISPFITTQDTMCGPALRWRSAVSFAGTCPRGYLSVQPTVTTTQPVSTMSTEASTVASLVDPLELNTDRLK